MADLSELIQALNELGEQSTRALQEAARRDHPLAVRTAAVLMLAACEPIPDLPMLATMLVVDLTYPEAQAGQNVGGRFEDALGALVALPRERAEAIHRDPKSPAGKAIAARVVRIVDGSEERDRILDFGLQITTGHDLDYWIEWVRARRR